MADERRLGATTPTAVLPYLASLDGLRAIAVAAVVVYHTSNGWLPGGFLGVEVFFVVSGYLITLLLIGEFERTGRIDLGNFWIRRARRLLPALFLLLIGLTTYVTIFRREELGALRGDVFAGLTYVSNWFQIWTGDGYTEALQFAPLRHLWSLGVEEQFYLLWPIVMIGLSRVGMRRLPNLSRWLVLAAIIVAAVTAVFVQPGRTINLADTPEAYVDIAGRELSRVNIAYLSTISRSTGLLVGAAFAMIWRPVAMMRGPLRRKPWIVDLAAVIGLAALWWSFRSLELESADGHDPFLFRGGLFLVDIATVSMIAAATHRRSLINIGLGVAPLRWLGSRSYGLYLFHWPVFQAVRDSGRALTLTEFLIAMPIALAITELSYRFVEWPIRRADLGLWVQRLRAGSGQSVRRLIGVGAAACVAVVGFAGTSMVTAELTPTGFEVSQQVGGEFTTRLDDTLDATTSTIPPDDPVGSASVVPVPVDSEPADTEPLDTEPPGTEPPGTEPQETEPSGTEPQEVEAQRTKPLVPIGVLPSDTEPADTEPSDTEPADTEPSGPEPSDAEPADTEPAATEPAATESPDTEPADTEPTDRAPVGTGVLLPATVPQGPPPDPVIDDPDRGIIDELTTTTSTTTTTTLPPTTTTTTTSTTTTSTIPPTLVPPVVHAVGDSVMLGAAENLAERGIVVDAEQNRQMADYLPVVQDLASEDAFGDVFVVHLGTNNGFDEETMVAFFDALREVPRVIVLNVHADRGWTGETNAMLATVPERFDNVQLLDWNTLATQCGGDCLYGDGIHLPPDGRRWYASLIFDLIGL